MAEQIVYKNKITFLKAESTKGDEGGTRGYKIECMGDDENEVIRRAVVLKAQAENETD